jgi:transcriptional/translational regulatory protein YebC/TACO1
VKNILDKNGAKLGGPGSVSYMKSLVPMPTISLESTDKERLVKLRGLLSDLDDVIEVWTNLAE